MVMVILVSLGAITRHSVVSAIAPILCFGRRTLVTEMLLYTAGACSYVAEPCAVPFRMATYQVLNACIRLLPLYSIKVGDMIKVKQKEDMWSWGVLERGGAEGW